MNAPHFRFPTGVPMQNYERMLIQAVAQNPVSSSNYLMSPQSDLGLGWFVSTSAKKFFSALAELSMTGSPISVSSILLHRDSDLGQFTGDELQEVLSAWKSGKDAEPIDLVSLTRNIRTDNIKARADEAIGHYQVSVVKEPAKVITHLDSLGSKLAMLSHSGVEYDANSANHLDEPQMAMRGTWGANSILDKMFSRDNTEATGGKPSYGLVIASMPTGSGKTTLGITMAAYALAYSDDKVVIMSNEIVRSIYSNSVFRALKAMYAGTQTDDTLKEMMGDRLHVYAPSSSKEQKGISVNSFELMRKIIYWEKPQLAIMDSITGVSAPSFASKMSENKAHEVKADAFRDVCLEEGVLMYAPGNMSEEHQKILKSNKPEKLQSVMIFGSTAYQNTSDWCFLGWRNYTQHGVVNIKRTKNRHGTSLGEQWQMRYDFESGIYRPAQSTTAYDLN